MPLGTSEYCLFWIDHWSTCMQKGEWSGWAQAVGSLLALAIAIALPAKARRDARIDAKAAVYAYMASVVYALEKARDACAIQNWADFDAARLLVHDAAQAGALLHAIPAREAIITIAQGARMSIIELVHKSAGHTKGGNWGHWHAEFEHAAAAALKLLDDIQTHQA